MEKKEKESWTLLWVWTAYLPVKEIKWEFYVKVSDFTKCMDGIRIEQEADRKHIEKLEEENKKLNIKVASLEWEIKWLNSVIDKLKEENQTLELWLDNKEKVNKSLREENEKLKKYYDRDKEELMESCYDLARENNKLKKDVDYRHHRAMVAERGWEDED